MPTATSESSLDQVPGQNVQGKKGLPGVVRLPGGAVVPALPELQLLLCCARVASSPAYHAHVRDLIMAGIDWDFLYALAKRHKLLPLLALHVREQGQMVPQNFNERLRNYSFQNARWVLQIVGETVEILAEFEREGIPAVPYKGPVLGAQVYGNVALRQAGDIDILVRRSDVARAREVVLARGYRPRHELDPGGKAFMVQSRYGEMFEGSSPFPLELHWAFTNGDIALPLSLESLRPNLGSVMIGRNSIPTFGIEDLLIILCVHGSKHRWDRIEWLCGVAEAIRGAPTIDWDRLIDRAARLGVRRMLLLGLLLAHDVLEAPVPGIVVQRARSDRPVTTSAEVVPTLWLEPTKDAEVGSLPIDLFRFGLREGLRDRLRFLFYRITTPSRPESWAAVRLGNGAIPVHGIVRPFRLAARLIRGRFRFR